MINALLTGIFNVVISLVNFILTPIDNIISQFLPSLASALSSISQFFSIAISGLGWCISLTGISSTAISLIVSYYTFTLTVPLLVSTVKLAIKWYDKLKP